MGGMKYHSLVEIDEKMKRLGATCVFVLMVFTLTAQAVKVMRPEVTESDLWNDEEILNHTLLMDNKDASINFTMEVRESIVELYFHINVTITESQKSSITVWLSMNLCQILAVHEKVPMLKSFFDSMDNYGEIFEQCPIKRGSYYLTNMWFTEEPWTGDKPTGEGTFEINFNASAILPNTHRVPVIRDTIKGTAIVMEVDELRNSVTTDT